MNKKDEELPGHMIISVDWKQPQLYDFFRGLTKGSIFGYSLAFKYNDIIELASTYGVKVKLLPINHPLRKKYNYYVLKVASIKELIPLKSEQITKVGFENVHYYAWGTTKGNRACQGDDCGHIILKDSSCLEINNLIELPSGKKAYKKKSYCPKCAGQILSKKASALIALRNSITSDK